MAGSRKVHQNRREISHIENKIGAYAKSETALSDAEEIIDLIEETGDESLIGELDGMLQTADKDIEDMRIRAILKGPYDTHNALLALHAGAGGTEACDWCSMLYRMYSRYCEKMGFKVFELDREAGDEAGIKSVDFRIEGRKRLRLSESGDGGAPFGSHLPVRRQ